MNRYFLSILIIMTTFNLNCLDFQKDIDAWLNVEISSTEFINVIAQLEDNLSSNSSSDLYYQRSVLNLYKGAVYLLEENKKESIRFLEIAISNAQNAIELKKEADYYRVLSEAGSYLMLQKGLRYIIKNSKEVNNNAEIAVELDPQNIKAKMIIANGLTNAPAIFGGDIKKGIKILEEVLTYRQITKEEKFNALLSLSSATENRDYVIDALKIYPNNKRAKEKLASFKG